MTARWRIRHARTVVVAVGLVAAGWAGFDSTAVSAAAQHAPAITLMVLVDGSASVPTQILAQAKDDAARVFHAIDVDIVWLEQDDARLEDTAVLKSMVIVRFLTREMTDRLHAPEGLLGKAASGARIATVFYHRIEDLSWTRHDKDTGSVLGHVIAHELGHLLLPPDPHSRSGIMQAGLHTQVAARRGLFFTESQARQIRTRLGGF
jgi:hypothetical protein